jgi:hypothetical protein
LTKRWTQSSECIAAFLEHCKIVESGDEALCSRRRGANDSQHAHRFGGWRENTWSRQEIFTTILVKVSSEENCCGNSAASAWNPGENSVSYVGIFSQAPPNMALPANFRMSAQA